MGLILTVGNPADVFTEEFADVVRRTLESHFGSRFFLDVPEPAIHSAELGWSGWRELQERARSVLPDEQIAHFLSMPAWHGVYIPGETDLGAFQFDNDRQALCVASVDHLVTELEAIGNALGLPTDENGLQRLAETYLDDDLCDDDMDIQTYAQLLPLARQAQNRNRPLWIVK